MTSRDLILQIYLRDGHYVLRLHGGQEIRLGSNPLPNQDPCFTRADLQHLSAHARTVLRALTLRHPTNVVELSQAESDCAIRQLAELGRDMLTQIFNDELVMMLSKALPQNDRYVIQVWSDDFIIPWELLYDGEDVDHPDFRNFWGYRYSIWRWITYSQDQSLQEPTINVFPATKLCLFANDRLTYVAKQEIPFFRRQQAQNRITLHPYTPESDRLEKFLAESFNIVHFACHTRPNKEHEAEDKSCLEVRHDCMICFDYLRTHRIVLKLKPLVFLNACDTDIRDPQQSHTIVRQLLIRGARGVVATESLMPDVFAAAFAKRFYGLFLGGNKLGKAMLRTRRSFLEQHHNPSGLLYAIYADTDTRLARLD